MANLRLNPMGDRVWVEPFEPELTTAAGIILPETAKEKPQQGKVLAVGPGLRNKNGDRQPPAVCIGDRILFARYAGTEFKQNGTRYLIMPESDILAVVEKEIN